MTTSSPSRFIQIHTLHAYPAVLLNRDDSGLAKRIPFGGATRTRISSQCLKRHWRDSSSEWSLNSLQVPMGVRSRHILDHMHKQLINNDIPKDIAEETTACFLRNLFQESTKTKKGKKDAKEEASFSAKTAQAVLFGWPEVDYLTQQALKLANESKTLQEVKANIDVFFKDAKKNIEAMRHHAGLEAALFGRMVTSDVISNKDASIHVAHSFTVHCEDSESDYFTVVDDLKSRADGDDSGAAGIFDTELTSGLYYGYVVIDVPALVSNLVGVAAEKWADADTDRELAGKVVQHLIHLIAKESPGAKKGSTAPYSWAEMMLIEIGDRQPRTLANAFREPVHQRLQGGTFQSAIGQLDTHLKGLDDCYGIEESRRTASLHAIKLQHTSNLSFNELAEWVSQAITNGRT